MLIKNVTVHNGKGEIFKNTDVLINNGKIVDIDLNIVHDGHIVDGTDKHLFPGFIDTITEYGVIGPGWGVNDGREATDPVLPQMDITYAFDHDNMNFQELYRFGTTAVGVAPSNSNVFSGQMAVYKTFGENPHKTLVKPRVAMVINISSNPTTTYGKNNQMPMTRMGIAAQIIETFEEALKYDKEKGYDSKLESMQTVLNGEMPLFIHCYSKSDLENVKIALGKYAKLNIVLIGAYGLDSDYLNGENYKIVMGDLTSLFLEDYDKIDFLEIDSISSK